MESGVLWAAAATGTWVESGNVDPVSVFYRGGGIGQSKGLKTTGAVILQGRGITLCRRVNSDVQGLQFFGASVLYTGLQSN